jgi:hypothetical protein
MRSEALKRAQCKWRANHPEYHRESSRLYMARRRAYLALAVIDTDIFNFTFLNV